MVNEEVSCLKRSEKEPGPQVEAEMRDPEHQRSLDGESDAQDNASVTSHDSEDSEMEAFDTYKDKILNLCGSLGFQDFVVEVIQHGYSFMNCVYSLTSNTDPTEVYILRVLQSALLRDSDGLCEAMMNEIAVLEYLRDKLPVPRVKCYDLSENNALGKPFTIQTRIAGVSLSDVYEDLFHKEKCGIIDQVIGIMVKLESVQFSNAGKLRSKGDLEQTQSKDYLKTTELAVELFDSRYPMEEPETDQTRLRNRQGPSLQTLLCSLIEGWLEREREDGAADFKQQGKENEWDDEKSWNVPTFKRLLSMLRDLEKESAFIEEPYPIVLYHWDLEPRNILVENSSGTWKISGIIDWDEIESVPRPLARKPPVWMWDFSEEPESGFLNSDQYPDPKLNKEGQALQDHFRAEIERVLPGYLKDAYGHGRWLRRLFPYAKAGLSDQTDLKYCDEMLDQWEVRHALVAPPVENSKGQWKRRWSGFCKLLYKLRL